jgi:hypothetical protein
MDSEMEVENKFLRDKIEQLQSKLREIKLICENLSELVSKENQMDWMLRRREMALRRIKREYKRQNAITATDDICGEDEVDD